MTMERLLACVILVMALPQVIVHSVAVRVSLGIIAGFVLLFLLLSFVH